MCCQQLAMGLGWSPGFSRPLSFVLLYAVFSRHLAGRTCSRRKTPFLLDVTMSSRPSPLKSVTTNWVPIRMAVPEPGIPGRVDRGGCPPRPPTDPGLHITRA